MKETIIRHIRAGFAGLYLVTPEEIRAEAVLQAVAGELNAPLYWWSVTAGLIDTRDGSARDCPDPVEAVNAIQELPEQALLILKDYHQFLGDSGQPASPLVTRTLKERLRECRKAGKVILILAGVLRLPPELDKEFAVLEFPLPDMPVLLKVVEGIAESAKIPRETTVLTKAAEAARGLTVFEAENILALSVATGVPLQPAFIAAEKAATLSRNGILQVVPADATGDDIGGLDVLKNWLGRRRNAFTPEAEAFGLPRPRGVLITGIPGTGKSLTAKAAANVLQQPLLRLDAGRLFAGLVGESEANLRRALQTAEAISPCILWIDEIEKGFSGSRSSGSSDGGTSARVFGTFLTWMQDRASPVFVVATANDIAQLPPEFLRKGRFDELFFVDLPDEAARREIWQIHVRKRGRDPAKLDLNALVRHSDAYTGSEIEQAVIEALFDAFDDAHDLDTATLRRTLERSVPLSTTMAEQVTALRLWAKTRARPAAGSTGQTTSRRKAA